MGNEIQKTESPLMAAAELVKANGNMDVGKLKELLVLQERWDATQAKKAYVQAMSIFKENPPEILKDKSVQYETAKGTTGYKHATLHNVTTKINTELSKHGLTASWLTSQSNGSIKVTCKITHIMGHSEETYLSAPPDATGSKNVIQAIGSTVTYLQRYTLLALTGLATYDQDDDGDKANKETLKSKKQGEIVDQAFFEFETENQPYLNDNPGFGFDLEKFKAAIIKHSPTKALPTLKSSIPRILEMVKPEEVSVLRRAEAKARRQANKKDTTQTKGQEAPEKNSLRDFVCPVCSRKYCYGAEDGIGVPCECGKGIIQPAEPEQTIEQEDAALEAAIADDSTGRLYHCNNCGLNFDEPKTSGSGAKQVSICPSVKCLSKNIVPTEEAA